MPALLWTLIYLLVFVVIIGVAIWIVRMLPLPHPWNQIAQAVVGLIGLVLIVSWLLGAIGPPPPSVTGMLPTLTG
jgi:hypothetical protein